MSKLSSAVKALIGAPHAKPNVRPAPRGIAEVFKSIGVKGRGHGVTRKEWVVIAAAATVTLNSPDTLTNLWTTIPNALKKQTESILPPSPEVRSEDQKEQQQRVTDAETIREVSLKSIAFNGIPKTINTLTAFRASLPSHITSTWNMTPRRIELATQNASPSSPSPAPASSSIEALKRRGQALWTSIYGSLAGKLERKLGAAHPDLPGVIITTDYGCLLADPPEASSPASSFTNKQPWALDRWHTSLVAISCLRAQGGAGPQVLSHVYGLKNAAEEVRRGKLQINSGAEPSEGVVAVDQDAERRIWLASDDGIVWLLESVDRIVGAFESTDGLEEGGQSKERRKERESKMQ